MERSIEKVFPALGIVDVVKGKTFQHVKWFTSRHQILEQSYFRSDFVYFWQQLRFKYCTIVVHYKESLMISLMRIPAFLDGVPLEYTHTSVKFSFNNFDCECSKNIDDHDPFAAVTRINFKDVVELKSDGDSCCISWDVSFNSLPLLDSGKCDPRGECYIKDKVVLLKVNDDIFSLRKDDNVLKLSNLESEIKNDTKVILNEPIKSEAFLDLIAYLNLSYICLDDQCMTIFRRMISLYKASERLEVPELTEYIDEYISKGVPWEQCFILELLREFNSTPDCHLYQIALANASESWKRKVALRNFMENETPYQQLQPHF